MIATYLKIGSAVLRNVVGGTQHDTRAEGECFHQFVWFITMIREVGCFWRSALLQKPLFIVLSYAGKHG